ncbi:hypothetical protein P152DRAFT_427992 [Eremomyces bilateralis CBS 781.70]|uniref:HEAT repeat protein n=1 Tax=Eremomyces bilateralis CBS 781.70 TaxID=1392243 RepID=A0A6G1GE36_9PEZI|nr:uncharacterized protein P152DRAFT_427992 [Eremomyces bilateralis CBS 781.70]KAF1816166.1 hypothetical protein P152DRAFT_427992 [Eremomyces bilateralis CBS 781.70]
MPPKTKRLSRPKSKIREKKEHGNGNRHRFQSFTRRIANISIDPIRSTRNERLEIDSDDTSSYFRTSLERWEDINLSGNFTNFSQKVRPLSQTLPQILHHEKEIHELLLEHIGLGDTLSLEPLLSLVSSFARDLGVRFEKYFPTTVNAVAGLVLRHNAVEVIEWSFMCLAWLFKFLFRVLIEDIKTVFDLMEPLLGASHEKPFLSRFAAEALSFLIRKAASSRKEEHKALNAIVQHSLESAAEADPPSKTFQGGLIVLYVESIKGIQDRVHLNGPTILHELVTVAVELSTDTFRTHLMTDIISGIFVEISPELCAEAHASLISVILEIAQAKEFTLTQWKFLVNLLFSAISVCRDRSEVDWKGVFQCIDLSMSFVEGNGVNHADIAPDVLGLSVLALQRCPLDVMLIRSKQLDRLIREPWAAYFVAFCEFFAKFGIERFDGFLLALFQRFVTEQWNAYETGICSSLLNILPRLSGQGRPIVIPQAWKNRMCSFFNTLCSAETDDPSFQSQLWLCNVFLELPSQQRLNLDIEKHLTKTLRNLLLRTLKHTKDSMRSDLRLFSLGNAHKCLLSADSSTPHDDWASICEMAPSVAFAPAFWEAMSMRCRSGCRLSDLTEAQVDRLADSMKMALSAPSRSLRNCCLDTLGLLCAGETPLVPIIDALQSIESAPVSIDTGRAVGIPIRKLATLYSAASSHPLLKVCIPAYCFGLLTVHFAPIWEDILKTLRAIVESKEGELVVSQISFEWLRGPDQGNAIEAEPDEDEEQEDDWILPHHGNTFLERTVKSFEKSFHQEKHAEEHLRTIFKQAHDINPDSTISRQEQALRVFNAVPHMAEKRSRELVPFLMKWTETLSQVNADEITQDDEAEQEQDSLDITLDVKERKSLLSLFSKFKNPKALYQSSEVHGALSTLLTVGDSDIQRSAMKALMTWKSPSLLKYQEALFDLIDDAKFKDRITIFLGNVDDDSALQPTDRPVVMPIVLRLLYGKAITKSGTRSAANRPENKRRAIFGALTRFPAEDLLEYIRICFGPLRDVKLFQGDDVDQDVLNEDVLDIRRQQGVLTMLRDLLAFLGSSAESVAADVVEPILYCLLRSYPSSSNNAASPERQKVVRSISYKCLAMLFEHGTGIDWTKYVPIILSTAVFDRDVSFAGEQAQAVSGLLQLVGLFYGNSATACFLSQEYPSMLKSVVDCLTTPNAKAEVQVFVLSQVLDGLAELASESGLQSQTIQESLLRDVDYALDSIAAIIEKGSEQPVLEASLSTLVTFSGLVRTQKSAEKLVMLVSSLLEQPKGQLNQKVKTDLLRILHHFIPRTQMDAASDEFERLYRIISSIFGDPGKPEIRLLLCDVVDDLSQINDSLAGISTICRELNSVEYRNLSEPDFTKRLGAYHQVNETLYSSLTTLQWLPILYNALHFLKVPDELSIRASASLTVRRFIEVSGTKSEEECAAYKCQVESVILPDLIKGLRAHDEQVRAEFVGLLGVMVAKYPSGSSVSSLGPLLMNGDEEASVFANILHIQHHRRLRAMRRMAEQAQTGQFTTFVVSQVLIPLMESFVLDKTTAENHHNLVTEAIIAINSLAAWLAWSQMRAILQKHCGRLKAPEAKTKTLTRLISSYLDSLSRSASKLKKSEDAADGDVDMSDAVETALSKSITSPTKFRRDLTDGVLPPLYQFLHKQDEDTVQSRMILAPCYAKTIKLLTDDEFEQKLVSLLSEVSAVLRSKSADTRDTARKAIADIVTALGPQSVGFVIKSLNSTLQRGYQRHVFSFTVHTLLVILIPTISAGDLDYCLEDLVNVMMDSTFGAVGEEKESEDYISQMKEVKSNKSFDAMEIVSKICTQSSIASLIQPLRVLLTENLPLAMIRKVDEFLRRIGLGIMQNPALSDRGILIFCFEILQQPTKQAAGARRASLLYKLVRFGLDLLRSVLQKHPNLKTPENLSGLLPPICDSILASHEEVQMSAMRLAASIIAAPLPRLATDAPVFVAEAVRIVEGAPNTGTELSQAALKLIVAVLKDRKDVMVKEKHIAHILKRIRTDIEEPERQGVMFSLLKAVTGRKMVMPELYEAMDTVARIMITNQTKSTRAMARSTYFLFLTNCPQSKDRFSKQVQFLVKNLQYQYEEGRESTMELMHLVLTKLGEDLVQQVIKSAFVPLVMVIINDESESCRAMAGILLKEAMQRAESEQRSTTVRLLQDWLSQSESDALRHAALQIWALWFEVIGDDNRDVGPFLSWMAEFLSDPTTMSDRDNWETIYFSLQTFEKFCTIAPQRAFSSKTKPVWEAMQQCLWFPHQWVKGMAAKLIGLYLDQYFRTKVSNEKAGTEKSAPSFDLGDDELIGLTKSHLRAFESPEPADELLKYCSRNLLALARLVAQTQVPLVSRRSLAQKEEQELENDESESEEVEQASRSIPGARGLLPTIRVKKAAIDLMASLCETLDKDVLSESIHVFLPSLYNMTDPSQPKAKSLNVTYNQLLTETINTSQGIMSGLQKKLGTTEYVRHYQKAKEAAAQRREERRVKRKLDAVNDPEAHERMKRKKRETSKARQKEVSMEYRGRRRGW